MAKTDESQVSTSGGKALKWQDHVKAYKWKPGLNRVRFFGLIYTHYRHNIKNAEEPTNSKKNWTAYCAGYDVDKDDFYPDRAERCIHCKHQLDGDRLINGSIRHFINLFCYDTWQNQPKHPPPDWSPIYMAECSQSLIESIKTLRPMNNGKSVLDPDFGALLGVTFNDKAASPALWYTASIDEKKWAFTEEMRALTVTQTMPTGLVVQKGNDKIPGSWTYVPEPCNQGIANWILKRQGIVSDAPAAQPSRTTANAKHRSLDVLMEVEDSAGFSSKKGTAVLDTVDIEAEMAEVPVAGASSDAFDEIPF